MTISQDRDAIDTIVDHILANPERADELKATLRTRVGKTLATSGFRAPTGAAFRPQKQDPEAFWDNVPI